MVDAGEEFCKHFEEYEDHGFSRTIGGIFIGKPIYIDISKPIDLKDLWD